MALRAAGFRGNGPVAAVVGLEFRQRLVFLSAVSSAMTATFGSSGDLVQRRALPGSVSVQ